METWISLRPRSWFGHKLVHSTNLIELGELGFEYSRGQLVVRSGETIMVVTDGHTSLSVGGMDFRTHYEGRSVERLESQAFSIVFGPTLANRGHADTRQLRSNWNPEESYILCRHHGWRTHCEIKADGSYSDSSLMLGCLAYFWVEAERERNWN